MNVSCSSPFVELSLIVSQLPFLVLLAEDLAQLIAVVYGESAQGHRHLHHIFLVDHDPVRLSQDLIQQGMPRAVGMAVGSADEVIGIDIGGGTDDGRHNHQIFKDIRMGPARLRHGRPQFFEQESGCRRLDIEAAHCIPAADQFLRDRIADRIPEFVVDQAAGVAVDGNQGITNDGEGTIAEQVDFDQPRILSLVFFPLNDGPTGSRGFHRNIPADLIGNQDHSAGVEAEMAEVSLQLSGPEDNVRPGWAQLQGATDFVCPGL